MVTIQIEKGVKLEEILVKALRECGGGSRSIHEIYELLGNRHRRSYDCSLRYNWDEFRRALENLVHDDVHLDSMSYSVRIRISRRFLRRYQVRFFLWGIPDEDKPEDPVSVAASSQ